MQTKALWLTVALVAGLVLGTGAAGALLAAPDGPEAPAAVVADVASTLNYQGRLTEPGGAPLDGTFPMRFQIYNDATAGTLLWDSGTASVNVVVDRGLFNVGLSVTPAAFDGQGLWLRIYVNGEWLSPRQALLPVPYALSLKPGAQIRAATGEALRSTSISGYGLEGYTDDGYAVRGEDAGTTAARGYGGYFTSQNGIGVYGYSSAARTASNAYAPGIYGRSLYGNGVYGVGEGTLAGVYGQSTSGIGLYGTSSSNFGVYGYSSTAAGVSGVTGGNTGSDYGVYGRGGDGTYGVYGSNYGTTTGLGVYGNNTGGGSAVSGVNEGSGPGTWGYSSTNNGVVGSTGRADNNWGFYTYDNIHFLGSTMLGAETQVVQNSDSGPLEAGDVVEIAGMGAAPAEGLPPLIQVRKSDEPGSLAVLGVVASGYDEAWLLDPSSADPTGAGSPQPGSLQSREGSVAPGGYLLVVVRGPVQVKVDGAAAIRAGDLLSSAARAGHAQALPVVSAASDAAPQPGTVLGKALEPWDGAEDMIYVYVTLQ